MDIEEAVRPCWMEVDLDALRGNVRRLASQLSPGTKIIAALKGDAYGHGAAPVARCLEACGVFSIATGKLEDAIRIREAGVALPILMFAGPLPDGMGRLLELGVTPTVHDRVSAEGVSRAAAKPTPVYVKVDCGLGRLGVPVARALDFIREVRRLEHLVIEGVYTHLSFHDAPGRELARKQFAAFDELLANLEAEGIDVPVSQALASSGLLAGLTSRANAVCPGSLLYGISLVGPDISDFAGYQPVVSAIKSRVIHVGESEASGRVGVVPLGLADGHRSLAPGASGSVLIRGRRVPIRGVSLEYIVLRLDGFEDVEVGDEVVHLGRSGDDAIALAEFAGWVGAAPHEALQGFEGRLPTRYLGD